MQDLIKRIEELPSLIGFASEQTEVEHKKVEVAKLNLKRLEAKIALQIKANNPSITSTILKYHVSDNEDIYKAQMTLIEVESVYRRKEINVVQFDNEFTSLKRVAQLKQLEARGL